MYRGEHCGLIKPERHSEAASRRMRNNIRIKATRVRNYITGHRCWYQVFRSKICEQQEMLGCPFRSGAVPRVCDVGWYCPSEELRWLDSCSFTLGHLSKFDNVATGNHHFFSATQSFSSDPFSKPWPGTAMFLALSQVQGSVQFPGPPIP